MSTLLLRLAAPLQSWGDSSRFTKRTTRKEPTKSGIIGLIAAAQGRRRTDSLEDLLKLRMGVRVDQPGTLLRDFQTEKDKEDKKDSKLPLSNRYYLSDAVFVVGIEGERSLLENIQEAIKRPKFPLFLGRRSCPPSLPLILCITDCSLEQALSPTNTPWQAAKWYQNSRRKLGYYAELCFDKSLDTTAEDTIIDTVNDVPISFNRAYRQYTWREVAYSQVCLLEPEPDNTSEININQRVITDHDPFLSLGG